MIQCLKRTISENDSDEIYAFFKVDVANGGPNRPNGGTNRYQPNKTVGSENISLQGWAHDQQADLITLESHSAPRHAMAKRKPGRRPSKRAKQQAQAKHTQLRKLRKFEKNELKAPAAVEDCDASCCGSTVTICHHGWVYHPKLDCDQVDGHLGWLGLPRRGSAKLQKAMAKESTTTSEPQVVDRWLDNVFYGCGLLNINNGG